MRYSVPEIGPEKKPLTTMVRGSVFLGEQMRAPQNERAIRQGDDSQGSPFWLGCQDYAMELRLIAARIVSPVSLLSA